MNITFLIGNGFDLRLGMKTRYTDIYKGYVASESSSDAIRKFKKMLKEDAPGYKTWSDFEMAMAQKAKEFDEEDFFIECLRDFKSYMVEHLEKEQSQFMQRMTVSAKTKSICQDEVKDSIQTFYKGLTPNVKNEFIRLGIHNNLKQKFISFNYTNILDNLLPHNAEIIHIHGRLGADIVLGTDNMTQVADLPYQTTRRFERAFIKPEFNKGYDNARLESAKWYIEKSQIICIYGMSLGKSDYSWVVQLKNWLLDNEDHHLVYFVHDTREFSKLNWDAIMDEEDDRIAGLLGKIFDAGDEMSAVFDQIHIPVGYDIFNIESILKEENIKVIEEGIKREDLRKQLDELHQDNLALMR